MAFTFSLATVLRARQIVEEQEERRLKQIQQQISITLEAVAQTETNITLSNTSRVSNLFKVTDGTSLHAAYGELTQLRSNRRELESQLSKLNQLKEMQIGVYNAARRNREMLTEMCDEKREVYESYLARREQSALDDNFISRHRRA